MNQKFETAVLFLIFNRLDTTKQSFEAIRNVKPPKLYIGADGPRENKEGEKNKVQEVREYVLNNIDWDCEVKTLFRDKNLGCGLAVSQAITWFFENEEMGIIVEDDVFVSQIGFVFMSKMLKKYKNDYGITHINLFNPLSSNNDQILKHNVSNIFNIWGWASWKRAWAIYDFNMCGITTIIKNDVLKDIFPKGHRLLYTLIYSKAMNLIDTWDIQWAICNHLYRTRSIIPSINLSTNIGFGQDGTHTKTSQNEHIKINDCITNIIAVG